jgi:hypothetical protein
VYLQEIKNEEEHMKNQMIEKELYILRTLKSDYCVKYYGIEITPKEMHIFM